jgi:hypothetical protein
MPKRRNYNVDNESACASPGKTAIVVTTGGTVRPCLYYIDLGSSASPADNAILWLIQRCTAAGTSTAYTPVPLDSADPAAISSAGVACSVEPTYTANKVLWRKAINQRSALSLVLDPDGALIAPATSNNGWGLLPTNSAFTGNLDCCVHFYE